VDLGNSYGMRVLDIPGLGSYEMTGPNVQNKRYIRSPWAFACMDIRGSELANLPWRLVDHSGKVVKAHALIDMIIAFGVESNRFEAMRGTEINMLLGARAYWLHDADLLQQLNPATIRVKKDRTGIQGFEQVVDGKIVNRFEREEIVYFCEFNPDRDLEPGPAVMQIVEKAINLEYEAGLYAEAFFKNDATPSIFLSTENSLTPEEADRVLGWWEKRFGGTKNKHKPAIADKGLKAQILSSTMKEIALTDIRTRAQNDICAAFRVPKILIGAMEEATYANAQEARKFMLEDVVIPRATYYADVINADLVQRVDPNVRFEFVPQDLPILQENADARVKRLSLALADRVISPEFYRAQMGWPEDAAPTAPPPTAPAEETPADRAMRSWGRKARKALRAGGSANVPFDTDDLAPSIQAAIRSRLAQATTEPEVERAFRDD